MGTAVTTISQFIAQETEDAAMERLLDPESRNGYVETENRPKRDSSWGTAYVVANLLVLFGGIVSIINRDKLFEKHTSSEYLSVANHCSAGRSLLDDVDEEIDSPAAMAGILLFGSGGAVAAGFLYLHLLKHRAMFAVVVSVLSVSALCLAIGILGLMVDDETEKNPFCSSIFILFGVFFLGFPFMAWKRLVLVSRLLKVGGEGLAANSALFSAVFFVGLGSIALVFLQAVFLTFSFMNGSVVPTVEGPNPCMWQVSTWGAINATFCAVVMFWTAQIANQVNVFTIGGTIAQWYFSVPGSNTRGTTLRSLFYAFKPSFGSLCLAGAVLALINLARGCVHAMRRRLGVCCSAILSMLLSWMETFTKFSTIRMAMTGEGFFDSARGIRDLLVRNYRDAYTVWWFPGFVLKTFAFVAAVAWGFTVFGFAKCFGFSAPGIAGSVSGIITLMSLSYVTSVVLSAVDTVFICWVLDCDRKTVTRVEVHEVFQQMPLATPGVAIEQPDGSFGYAPPSAVETQPLNAPRNPHMEAPHSAAGRV